MLATPTDASPASTRHLSMLLYKQSLCQFLRSVDEHPIPGHAHTHQGSTLTPWLLSSVCVSRATLARGLRGYVARDTLCRAQATRSRPRSLTLFLSREQRRPAVFGWISHTIAK